MPRLPTPEEILHAPKRDQIDVAYSNILDSSDPDRARKANVIGRDIGLPGATVTADMEGFGQERDNNHALNILGSDPHIVSFMTDLHNAASVKDDLPALSSISKLLGTTSLKNVSLGTPLYADPLKGYAPIDRRTPAPPPPRRMPTLGEWMGGIASSVSGSAGQAALGAESYIADAIGPGVVGDFLRSDVEASRATVQRDLDESNRVQMSIPTYIGQQAYSASQSIALMGAALLTGKPIASMGLQQGLQQYQQVKDRGGSANEALFSGTLSGAAESGFERYFGMGWLLGNFGKKATSKFLGRLLLREVPSEMATTAVQDFADSMVTGGGGWEGLKKRLPSDLLDTAASTALMVGMMGPGHHILSKLAPEAHAVDQIERAAAGANFIDTLMAAAEKSKTKAEDPETLRQFVEQRTQDTPIRNVYVPVEAAVTYMQSDKYNGELDRYQDQIAQAQQTQGDVVIPIADAVAHLSGTPAWEALKEDVRIEPGGLSRKEAAKQHGEIMDQLEARGKEIAAEVDAKQGQVDAAAEVYVEVKNRLRMAGVDDKLSENMAQIFAARYEARGARLGVTPMEAFKQSKISFPGEQPGQFDQGKARTVAAPAAAGFNIDTIDARMAEIGKEIGRQRDKNLGDDPLTHAMELAAGLSVLDTSGQTAETQAPDALKAIEEAKSWGRADIIELIRDRAERQGAAPVGEPGVEKGHARYEAIKAKMEEGKKATRALADQVIAAADAALSDLRGEQASDRTVAQSSVDAPPLEGMPQNIKVGDERVQFGPFAKAREAAAAYMKKAGVPYSPPRTYVRVDPARATRIAQAFDEMQHNPDDPEVKAAYDALKKETLAQWKAIEKTGLKVEFIKGEDPYGNPRNAILDVVRNNHLWVFPTEAGFGSSDADVSGNPLLETAPGVEISGQKVTYNDVFRIVHDYFGHIKEGVGFRADGEENAWRIHSAMYSPLARRALTTETRGQNSWVNFGPHGVANQTASSADTVYADQKIGLLPDWVVNEGAGDERTLNQDAALLGWEGLSQHLTDEEKDRMRAATQQKILSLVETLPHAEEMAAAAVAGRAKRGWYEQSAQAILDVFGAADAPRFAALLASLSPQTSVQGNLFNALRTWTIWNDAGRPQTRREIVEIMGQAVQGKKGTGSVLNAWINNSFAALTAKDLSQLKLSGAKVDSFAANLMGAVDEVTNDTWMAMYSGLDHMSAGGRSTKTPLYKALNAVVRRAADILTKKTGETWTPAEVQETVWSFAKTLYEMRDRAGETATMRQLLEAGRLTHADIANTPDFAALFANGVFRTILEQGGYGEQIAALESRGRPAPVDGEGRITDAAETGFSQRDLTRFLGQAADRLEQVRARRQANARVLNQDALPEAGWTPERVSGLIDQFGNEDGSSSAIAVMMSPDEYLAMNASEEGREVIAKRVAEMEAYGGKLDVTRLSDSPPIYLGVALGGENDTRPPPMVRGHDGRHRMALLKAAGVARVPVIVSLTDKDGKPIRVTEPMKVSNIIPNRSRRSQMDTGDRIGEVSGVPISFRYQDHLEQLGGRVLFQSPFYSAVERAIENSTQQRASAQQWKATLAKTPGVKKEELDWSGITDWLDIQQGSVDKAQLLQLIQQGGIKVDEVVFGDVDPNARRSYEVEPRDRGGEIAYDVYYTNVQGERHLLERGFATQEAALDAVDNVARSNTQFSNWSSDPSNPTYRELLITLPLGEAGNPERAPSTHWDTEGVVAHARFMDKVDAEGKRVLFIEEVQSDWHQKGRDQGYETAPSPELLEKITKAEDGVREVEGALDETQIDIGAAEQELTKLVGPKLVAAYDKQVADIEERAKTNDKLTPEAVATFKEVMERQTGASFFRNWRSVMSDGYVGLKEIRGYVNAAQLDTGGEIHEAMAKVEKLYQERFDLNQRLNLRENELRQLKASVKEGIPEAPFKTSWPALVMKRMIAWGAEHGYDRIAWTTGEEQAQRYNLSQSTGPITVERAHEQVMRDGQVGPGERIADTYLVSTRNGNAMDAIRQQYGLTYASGSVHRENALRLTADQMREVFGGDLGKRLIEAAENAPSYSNGASSSATLSDAELNVGGEGMKAFYDRNLVNITNDIIKKFGAKVGKIGLFAGSTSKTAYHDLDAWVAEAEEALALSIKIGDPAEEIALREESVASRKRTRDEARARIAEGTNPGFEITPQLREAAAQGFSMFQGERGSTTFTDDGAKIIRLFSSADRSTLLHETGHIWLEELKADAEVNEDAKRDYETVLKWFAANGIEVGKSGYIPTEGHELWARGVERYFMEGKSPSIKLGGVFKTFKAWLLRIYGVVQNLQTPITPEIREVMDRMIATDQAIDDARAMNAGAQPLFKTAEEANMTDAEFADYQARVANARDEAYDALLFKTMESIRKRKTGEMRDARAAVRSEVAEHINKQPQFRLLHLLRTGKWLGEPERPAVDVKLNSGWLIDNFGEGILDKLPKGPTIWSGDGETGDVIAEMVGLSSGAEVVNTLVGMRAASDELRRTGETRSMRDKLVAEETDRVMAARYGDPLNDGSIEEEAIAAINSARQGEIIASEARQLAKRKHVLGTPTPYQFAREWARRTVASGHVRDVASRAALQRYIRAANKAARAAEEAILKGDIDEAYRQKQAHLLNHALLAEAKAAADRVDRIVAKLKKLAGRAAQKSIDPEYFEKIQSLLENYDFKERTQKSIDEQQDFQKWLEAQRAKGFEVHVPPRLDNNGTPYTRVSVQELESLGDLVDSLEKLGRMKQKLVVAGRERDFAEFRDKVVARIRALPDRGNIKRGVKGTLGVVTKGFNAPINEEQRMVAAMASELLKVETIAEELDGGQTGPLHDVLVLGATTAENTRHDLREKVLMPLAKMYHELGRKYWRHLQERVTIPELTWNTLNEGDPRLGTTVTITRSELLAIFMNMGNLSNLEKLSRGERWPTATLQVVMDRELTKEDYEFAQQMWDTVEQLWPDIVRVEREMSGVVPERVVDNPIETRFGTYRGGYWPVVYDPARWQVAEDLEGKEIDDMFGLKSGVATQKGHTISRTGAFGPINLSLERVLFHHIEQVVTRIAYAPYARDVLRTIRDKSIRGWIDTKLGPEYRKQIEPWLGRQIHNGYAFPKGARWWDKLMREFRVNTTIAAMGFRISTGVAQTLGLGASAQRIGARWVGVGLMRLAQHPRNAARFAYAKSPELYHRTEAVNREVAEVARRMQQRHTIWNEAQHWAMFHIGLIDRYMVSLPTWLGAYEKARTAMDLTDEQAVAFADKAVRMSQGTGREKDMAAVQSPNSEAMRFFTMFYTPWNVMFNAQWQAARGVKRGDVRPMIAVTFWWMMVQMLGGALMGGDWPEWDDPKDIEKWFARNVFFGLFAGIPVARDAATYANRKLSGQYASDIGTTPITRVATAIGQAWNTGKRKVVKGEDPKHPIKQAGDLTAILLGVPTSQIGSTGQFAWDVHEGKQDPKSVSDWYFGLTTGKVPEPKEEAEQ